MKNRLSVKAIKPTDAVHSVFLIEAPSLQQSRNGPYWRLALRDATGSVEAKIWHPESLEFPQLSSGQLFDVEGHASLYRDQVQVTIKRMRPLSDDERNALDLRDFMPASPRPPQDMWNELLTLCKKEFTHAPWRHFVCATLKDESLREYMLVAPAAKTVHHAYTGGLLEHTLSVAHLVLSLCDHYPHLDRQTLLAGAIFHDIGKIWEYSGGLANEYTDAGRLLGHTELALEYLGPRLAKSKLDAELVQHFKHLILSHHGNPEYGAARLPQTPEAMLLHFADNIDAKMAQCHSLFADWTAEATGWSPYQKTLERFVYQPKRTPVALARASHASRTAEKQCLSLLKE